jgi:hypothetical protein
VKPGIIGVSALAVVLFASVCVAADDAAKPKSDEKGAAASAAPASAAPAAASERPAKAQARSARLNKPWRDMTSLTDEQKKQIADIHRKVVQDKKVIDDREKADIMALLNETQKGELKAMQDKESADKKARAGSGAAAKTSAASEKSSSSPGAGDADRAREASDKKGSDSKGDNKAGDKEATAAPAK